MQVKITPEILQERLDHRKKAFEEIKRILNRENLVEKLGKQSVLIEREINRTEEHIAALQNELERNFACLKLIEQTNEKALIEIEKSERNLFQKNEKLKTVMEESAALDELICKEVVLSGEKAQHIEDLRKFREISEENSNLKKLVHSLELEVENASSIAKSYQTKIEKSFAANKQWSVYDKQLGTWGRH